MRDAHVRVPAPDTHLEPLRCRLEIQRETLTLGGQKHEMVQARVDRMVARHDRSPCRGAHRHGVVVHEEDGARGGDEAV